MRQERKTKRKQTSYVTLFSLKDKAALFPFVRGVMQYCTTKYHPRPKCGRNIHRYINIKVSPIQTFLPIYSHIFFLSFFFVVCFCTHTTACDPCVCKDVRFVLVYASVCVCVWSSVWKSSVTTTCTFVAKPHACQIQLGWDSWGERLGAWGGRGQSKSKTEKFTVTDGR